MNDKKLNRKMEEKIYRTALSLLARKGFDGNSVVEIARKTKIDEALVSSYFEDHEQLISDLYIRVMGTICI